MATDFRHKKRPLVIWTSVVLALVLFIPAFGGLLVLLAGSSRWAQAGWLWHGMFFVLVRTVLSTFLVSVAYAAFKGAPWGRPVCIIFAWLLVAMSVHGALHEDPHPLFAIRPGAEQAGAVFGGLLMIALSLLYAYRVTFGRHVREYFGN